MFTNPFLQNFFAYSQQNPWQQAPQMPMQQPPMPQGMPPYQMPMMQPPVEQMGGLLGKATPVGKIPAVSGRPVQGDGRSFPTMRTLAVRA